MVSACPTCNGRGSIIKEKCVDCRGRGRISIHRKLCVKFQQAFITVKPYGWAVKASRPVPEASPDGSGTRGDLHVLVRVTEDNRFERDGDNLIHIVSVAFTQLALGATIEVDSIDESHSLDIPSGTQTNEIFRIEGAGLPDLRSSGRGDLVIIVRLSVPKKLSGEQRELLEEYAKSEDIPVHEAEVSFWEKLKGTVTGG